MGYIMKLSLPKTTRDLMKAFVFYDKAVGISSIVDRFDLSCATPRQIYNAVLARPPEDMLFGVNDPAYSSEGHLKDALLSVEFQDKCRELILNAFPEKKRLVFIHIPKTAGTDLVNSLRLRFPWLEYHMSIPDWYDVQSFHSAIKDVVLNFCFSDSIAVTGHTPLSWYQDKDLVRFSDEFFSVIRDPVELVYSYGNFIMSKLVEHPNFSNPATREWLSKLDLDVDDIPDVTDREGLIDLAMQIIRHPDITSPNILCTFLGRVPTAESALENMFHTDIEVTDTSRYTAWRTERWRVEQAWRENVTPIKVLSDDTVTAAHREFMMELTAEDRVVYARIMSLFRGEKLSVRGSQIA